ncbi:MAG TPA: PhnD/SsuA/transferrin family substrate-binding protein [Candidatus Limnocylindrales bacterium]|nr:PhnD/SsuA/transferrin family substrate-binding protein [Candidatus Limnocylindrales bacterium]
MFLQIACCLLINFLLLGSTPALGADNGASIFFYNPDANLKDVSVLKARVGNYLKKTNLSMDFQPFIKFEVMMQQIEARKPSFLIISSWYYPILAQKYPLTPLLIPIKNGQKGYKKVLVTLEDIQDLKELSGKTLATTPLGDNTPELLADNFFKNNPVDISSMKIITVPKDLDALLAVSYKRVNLAMVVPHNIDILKAVNPAVAKIKIIYTSPEILHPLLVVLKDYASAEEIEKIKSIFLKMSESPDGKEVLNLLNYDRWIVPDEEILGHLE